LSISLTVIIIGYSDKEAMGSFRATVIDAVVPVLNVLSSPIKAASNAKLKFRNMVLVYNENERLAEENKRLLRIQSLAERLEIENRRLRELVHFIPGQTTSYISARIVTGVSGPYARSVIVSSGKEEGLKKGHVVVNNKGLVGRVTEVGNNTSRILLITDINSKIPIVTGTSGERGIIEGNNSDMLSIIHLPIDSKVKIGERVVTSGDGKYFPAGVPVGIVESISNKLVTVKPFVDWSRLEYVSIADFGS
jgi:rod shape-determining protein MreC